MYLKRLEIHGFKSFANKTTMEFAQGIIAIVGPNGSGKSNVADSLRWVLGEQSAKMIRGKGSTDVIFAGSEKKIKMGFAEVFATFDNRDRRIPVDAAEVSIGRRVDRSGESEYLINGNRVRLLDIVDLVLKSNIGTSRYTVIGQGTIDQMILAGPSEIKNLLDEASGVKNYYIKRDKTLRRLEQTAQNLMRAEDLIAEIEPRLKSLRRQAKKMEARAELEQELRIYQREFFGKTYTVLKTAISAHEVKIAELDKEKVKTEAELFKFREESEGLEKNDLASSEKFKQIQAELSELQTKKNYLLENLSMVRGKMQSQKTVGFTDSRTISVEIHQRKEKIADMESRINTSTQQQTQIEQESSKLKTSLQDLESKLKVVYEIIQNPVSVDWKSFDHELIELGLSFENFYAILDRSSEIVDIKTAAERLRTSFSNFTNIAKVGVASPQLKLQEAQKHLQELLKQKEQLVTEIQRQELEFSRAKISSEFLEKELLNTRQDLHHLELELQKAESGNFDDFVLSMISEEQKIQDQLQALGEEINKVNNLFKEHQAQEDEKKKSIYEAESHYRTQQDVYSKIKDQISVEQIEKTKFDTQMEVLKEEVLRILGEQEWVIMSEKAEVGQTQDLENKISRLKNQLDMIGGMDELTMKEYQETETRFINLSTQVTDLKKGIDDLRAVMDELDEHIKTKFNEAFHKINEKFEYYFRVLFNGGRAYLSILKEENKEAGAENEEESEEELETVDQLRPEEKIVQKYEKGASNIIGIDIKATPPNKKLASIQALSGGERALTSIALLCSLLTCFPSPFVVLDEVDAALDDANTIRFGQILATLAHQTQFITITHNRETMAQSGMLYGVTMGDDGMSKLLSVKLEQAKQYAK